MIDLSDGFRIPPKRSLDIVSSWFYAFYKLAFLMSCFFLVFPFAGWDVRIKYPEFREFYTGLAQISFVGSVYFPCLLFIRWRQDETIVPIQLFGGTLAFGIVITSGVWLGDDLLRGRVLYIAAGTPIMALPLLIMTRVIGFLALPTRR